jgi:hypothetical protein
MRVWNLPIELKPVLVRARQSATTFMRRQRKPAIPWYVVGSGRASGAEAMVAHLGLLIAKMKRDRFGASAECGRKLLDQLEMQLEEFEAAAAEDEPAADGAASDKATVRPFTRAKPFGFVGPPRMNLLARSRLSPLPRHGYACDDGSTRIGTRQ